MQAHWFGRFYGNGEPVSPPSPPSPPAPPEPKTFTQEEVNAIMNDHKKSLKKELDDLKKLGDPAVLNKKVKELSDTLMTKEELARQQAEELKTNYENQLKETVDKATAWENRFKATTFETSVATAALKHNAFDTEQLGLILRDKTVVTELTDKEGKPTGQFVVKTAYTTPDGKKLELTMDEAVAKMREDKRYANQFKVSSTPGTGLTLNNNPTGPAVDGQPPTDTADFMKWFAAGRATGAIKG